MYLSKLVLDPGKPGVRRDLSDCCQMHRSVMASFPGDGEGRLGMGILYRVEGESHILIQSLVAPDPARCPAGYAIAGVKDVTQSFGGIQENDILRFALLANPSHREVRRGPRHALSTRPQWLQWLREKGELFGFAPEADDGIMTAPRRVYGHKNGTTVTLGAVYFEGVLQVTRKMLFRSALEVGIGQGKSYGLGLLSIAKAFQFSSVEVARSPAVTRGQSHPIST